MIKESYDRNAELKKSKFLDRFEGKTSTIGKAGLLSLLQQNMPQSKFNNQNIAIYLQSGLIESKQRNPQVSARLRSYQLADQQDKRSSNHSFKTELPRRNSMAMGSMSSMASTKSSSIPKLPKIGKQDLGFNLKSSLQLKQQRKNTFQSSNKQTAQQHYQFLNLFEERLRRMNKK